MQDREGTLDIAAGSVDELLTRLDDPAFYAGDPFPTYARLRRDAPIAWNPGLGYWVASRHAEVVEISKDVERFCSGRGVLTFEIGVDYPAPPTMMHTDPPEHTRYRNLVWPGFSPPRMRVLEPRVRERARTLIGRIEAGVAFDVVEGIAIEYPLMIIAELLGVPDDAWPRFYEWSEASIPQDDGRSEDDRAAARAEMQRFLMESTLARRGDPRDDLVSVLANAEVNGERLSDDELLMFLNQLLVAGNETVRNTISSGMWALAHRPDQWRRLVGDPSLVPRAVEEWLRWSSAVISFMRTAIVDTELAGQAIRAGDPVLMLYASANRDEAVFGPTAGAFDAGRNPNPHVAFGFGAHFCVGAALARMEARVLLEELLARFTTIEPAGAISRSHSSVIAGITHAPLTLGV